MKNSLRTYLTSFCRTLFLSFLLLEIAFVSDINAQLPNGTISSQEYFDLVIANIDDESLEVIDTVSPELNINLKLEVFVVMDDQGEINFDNQTLISNLSIVNAFFNNIGLNFTIGNITEVPEYDYSVIEILADGYELDAKYSKQNKMNLFLVDEVSLDTNSSYGYTTYPIDTIHNNIYIRKDYLFGNNLSALFGSFFGLMHTYETIGEIELVDGTNCLLAGDVICDTYADPGSLSTRTTENCQYLTEMVDPNGDYYLPSVTNIMSDSRDDCKCLFTMDQYRRMKYYFKKYRNYLK